MPDVPESITPVDIQCGIYFLRGKAGEILYVGQSVNVLSRVASHLAHKTFVWYSFLEAAPEDLDRLERDYILLLRPALNRSIPGVRERDLSGADAEWLRAIRRVPRAAPAQSILKRPASQIACPGCGRSFTYRGLKAKKFCSGSCRQTFHNGKRPTQTSGRSRCESCGDEYEKSRVAQRFCSKDCRFSFHLGVRQTALSLFRAP